MQACVVLDGKSKVNPKAIQKDGKVDRAENGNLSMDSRNLDGKYTNDRLSKSILGKLWASHH